MFFISLYLRIATLGSFLDAEASRTYYILFKVPGLKIELFKIFLYAVNFLYFLNYFEITIENKLKNALE